MGRVSASGAYYLVFIDEFDVKVNVSAKLSDRALVLNIEANITKAATTRKNNISALSAVRCGALR